MTSPQWRLETYPSPLKVSSCPFVLLLFFPFPQSPGNHWFAFCHYSLQFLELYKWNHIMCFLSGSFTEDHSLRIHPYCSMYRWSFYCYQYPIYGYTTICLSSQLLMDIWIVSSFWLSQIKLLWTFTYKSLTGHMLSFLQGKSGEWECLNVQQIHA